MSRATQSDACQSGTSPNPRSLQVGPFRGPRGQGHPLRVPWSRDPRDLEEKMEK